MDSKPNWVKQVGLTPGRMALIAVLALVFAVVLYIQLGGSSAKPPAAAARSTAASESNDVPSKSSAKHDSSAAATGAARRKTVIRGDWQSPSMATVVEYDPFALPASFPQPPAPETTGVLAKNEANSRAEALAQRAALAAEREQTQSQLVGLRQQGVRVIIKRNDQYVAIVGDQEVHVGDQLNGFTVTAIDADSVHVAKDLTQ